jgi:hypothetical protein
MRRPAAPNTGIQYSNSKSQWAIPAILDADDVFMRKNDSYGKHLVTKGKRHAIIAP